MPTPSERHSQRGKFRGPLLAIARHCGTIGQGHAPELKRIHFTFMSLNNN
jgi:hypothetical protein